MKTRVRNSDPFTHVIHNDVTEEDIERRDSAIKAHARLAGLQIRLSEEPVSKNLDQWAAAELRVREETKTLRHLRRRHAKGFQLLAVTIVFPHEQGFNVAKFLTNSRASRLKASLQDAINREPEIQMIEGCLEVDRCHKDGEAFWQYTAHLVVAVSTSKPARAANILKRAFALEPSKYVKRPVMIKELHDARNWVRYCYKSLSYGCVVRRCIYDSKPDSKTAQRSSRKVRLLPLERNALIMHLAKHGVERQLVRLTRPADQSRLRTTRVQLTTMSQH